MSDRMKNSMMYKMCYYKFGEMNTQWGEPFMEGDGDGKDSECVFVCTQVKIQDMIVFVVVSLEKRTSHSATLKRLLHQV